MSASATIDRLRVVSLRDLLSHPVRHGVSVAVVTVCSALLVAVFGIYGSIVGSVDQLAELISGDVSLQLTGGSSGDVPAELLPQVRRVDGVGVAAPIVLSTVPVDGERALLLGVDPSMAGIRSRLGRTIADEPSAPDVFAAGELIVGPRIGGAPGATLDIAGHRQRVGLTVKGEAADQFNGGRFVIAPIAVAQRIIGHADAFDSILVTTKPRASADDVKAGIDAVTGGRVVTSEPLLRGAQNGTILTFLRDATLIATSLALVVAVILVFNTMNMAVIRRRATFATMRAIGARHREIVRYILGEAFIVGAIGGVIGVPLGVLAGYLAIRSLPAAFAQSIEASIGYHLPVYAIPVAIAAAVVACVIAALGGVRTSARFSPIETVGRADIRAMDEFTQPFRVLAGAVGGVLLVIATAGALLLDNILALFSCVVFIIAGLLLCYAFAQLLVDIVRLVAQRMPRVGPIASSVVARARGRVWVTTMVVVVAVAVGICASGALTNLVGTAATLAAPLKDVPLYVSVSGSNELPTGPVLAPEVQAAASQVPGVAEVVPLQFAYGTIGDQRILLGGTVQERSPSDSTTSIRQRAVRCSTARAWSSRGVWPGNSARRSVTSSPCRRRRATARCGCSAS